jgi:LAO/AO transport system kinase
LCHFVVISSHVHFSCFYFFEDIHSFPSFCATSLLLPWRIMKRLFTSTLTSNVVLRTEIIPHRSSSGVSTPTQSTASQPTDAISNSLLASLPFRIEDISRGQRRALAKAITMVESDNPQHARAIGEVLRAVQQHTAEISHVHEQDTRAERHMNALHATLTPRIAISGSPGAGKSCFIESFGMYLVEKLGLSVGVIAVDPSSTVYGGSILGDKTRMEKLSMHPKAFVRPSPSRGHLGGVTARAWEVMSLLECARFDVILVETVGVGQSEIAAKYMTDLMMLLVPPASGDELQGIKKGIVEVADMIVVTKNDGERVMLAQQTKAAYRRAVQFEENCGVDKPVIAVSSEAGTNIDKVWEAFSKTWQQRLDSGALIHTRQVQQTKHFEAYFEHELLRRAKELLVDHGDLFSALRHDVFSGHRAPREAGELALNEIFRRT